MVPVTEAGRLSATHFLDGKKKMEALHTRQAEYMKELGLERGRQGSRATHQRVKQFYASVTRDPELKIEPDRIPDPGRLKVMTAEAERLAAERIAAVEREAEERVAAVRREEERERSRELVHERGQDPWRGPQGRAEDRDRGSRDHDTRDRGGHSFDR